MEVVVNEWLPDYLRPTAADADKRKLQQFLTVLMARPDTRIVVRRPSPFLTKLSRLSKDHPNDPLALRPHKFVMGKVLQNSDKCRFVDDTDIQPLPKDLTHLLGIGNFGSDTYLFEAATAIEPPAGRLIITTDVRLINYIGDSAGHRLILLDDFLVDFAV
jgi:hypothetical protein